MPPDPPVGPMRSVLGFVHMPRGMAAPDRGALPLSGLTVLLVEDSRFTSDALRLLCQRSGARMRRAETLVRARAHLRTYRPDVVIVDLGLPDGRGEDLISQLAGKDCVVLAMSGDPVRRAAALRTGADEFMDKPLPGLAAFQRLILLHLPGRFALVSTDGGRAVADPLALRDDFRHAAEVLAQPDAGDGRRYLMGFLAGLARSTGDVVLAKAARDMAEQGDAGRLRAVLRARLGQGDVI